MATTSIDVEEFWEDLLAYVESGPVIPVVGPELLTVEVAGKTVPLYRRIADRLLAKYGITGSVAEESLRPHHELTDAVAVLATAGRRIRDLYRPVHDILEEEIARNPEPPRALAQLAEISHFRLFATTTPDDLLAQALNAVRYGGAPHTDEIIYAPNLPNERRRDLPELMTSSYSAVFYLFGRAEVSPFYAIHEEDALEFPYMLQQGNGPERVFAQMRSRHLLFIGCNFAEWLSRFFIRMSSAERLFSDQRSKREFLVGHDDEREEPFTLFLRRFSRDTRWLGTGATDFVDELHRRWKLRNPTAVPALTTAITGAMPSVASTPTTGTIFLSYAREDSAAALVLKTAVHELGGDVAWLDKAEITAGDVWENVTRGAIQRCSVFLAVISAATERRTEGYFRLEWADAVDRARRIQGRKFIIPVVVDADYAGDASRYTLVPDAFRALQFAHAPNGQPNDGLRAELTKTLRDLRRGRAG